jgi:hypothetical protein
MRFKRLTPETAVEYQSEFVLLDIGLPEIASQRFWTFRELKAGADRPGAWRLHANAIVFDREKTRCFPFGVAET